MHTQLFKLEVYACKKIPVHCRLEVLTAAEELLAEEEKEKQAASTKAGKAKQSKGKKGKGRR